MSEPQSKAMLADVRDNAAYIKRLCCFEESLQHHERDAIEHLADDAIELIAEVERLRDREATIVATLTAMRRDPNGHDANVMLERVLSLFGGQS